MPNYFTDLILKIDLALLGAIILFVIIIIVYALIREYDWRRRCSKLSSIKNQLYELTFPGKKIDKQICLPVLSEVTPQLFLDVMTNRTRGAVFFNEAEQKILKHCFASAQRLERIGKIARTSWNKWRRVEAILSLGYAQDESCLGTLKESINSKGIDISYFSIIALGQIRSVASAKILLDFLKRRRLYQYKIFSVLEIFPVQIAEEVVGLIDDKDPQVRAWSLKLISRLEAEQYLKKIEEMTLDKSEYVRAAACDCLGGFGRKGSKDALARCLRDDSWLVRVVAVKALSKAMGEECIPEIMGLINDASLSVIDSVKSVVTEYIEAALPYVEKFLHSNDEIARRVAIEALEVSGYITKLFKNILAVSEEEKKAAMRLLEGLILSHAHFGLQVALAGFGEEKRKKILGIIREISKDMADYLEENTAAYMGGQ